MSIYSMSLPPSVPGVYAIKCKTTGHTYVGSTSDLRSRYLNWAGALVGRYRAKPLPRSWSDAIANTHPADWTFEILEEVPGASAKLLLEKEVTAIEVTRNQCGRGMLLNSCHPLPAPSPTGYKKPKTTIKDSNGDTLSYIDASAQSGVPVKELYACAHYFRTKGRGTVKLSELVELYNKKRQRPRALEDVGDAPAPHHEHGCRAETAIVGDDGAAVSYKEAAKCLGVKPSSLYSRVYEYRKKYGVTAVRLADLKARTDYWKNSRPPKTESYP